MFCLPRDESTPPDRTKYTKTKNLIFHKTISKTAMSKGSSLRSEPVGLADIEEEAKKN